ncbi:MAG: hypothetical protein MUE44_20630 [Oscillatoriaceae cyanobacterium Prado104]|nr:hypothetical protein [Oscillatoriaceae cyanobacterium Prado104]
MSAFAKQTFLTRRQEDRSRFHHFYRLAVNTRVPVSEAGKIICIGARLTKFDPLRFALSVTNPINRNTAGGAIEVAEID